MLLVRTTLFFGCALCLIAQTDTPQPDTSQTSAGEEYSGPAILSRGDTPNAQAKTPMAFRPYIGLSAIYDTGLVPLSLTPAGQIPTTDEYGVELNLGAYTYRAWKHTTLSLDYRSNFRHYSNSLWDGTDQLLSLALTHKPTRRITITLRNSAGTFKQNYLPGSTPGASDGYLQLPQNDIYYNRVIFLSTSADLTYQQSARLSFNFGGEGNLISRQSAALYGMTGAVAHADMQYRFTRHTTLGVDYRFTHYSYTRSFGTADIHSVGLNLSTQFSPHVQFSVRAGGARVESLSLTQVTLDPAIAALLGVSQGIQAAYRLNYVPDVQARLTDSFRRSQFSLIYSDAVSPGNGVYLTSRNNTGTASYSYSGLHYWNFGVDTTYGRLSAILQTIGAYTTYGAGAGATRELGKGLHAVLRIDARHYNVNSEAAFKHTEYRATLGFDYSPGEVPLRLW